MTRGEMEYRRLRLARLAESYDLLPSEAFLQELEALGALLGDHLTDRGRSLLTQAASGPEPASVLREVLPELVDPQVSPVPDPVADLVGQVLPHLSETLSHAQYLRLEKFAHLSPEERREAWKLVAPHLSLPSLRLEPLEVAPSVPKGDHLEEVWQILAGLLLLEKRQPVETRGLRLRLAKPELQRAPYQELLSELESRLSAEELTQTELRGD